jgi:nicotinamide mononucleotide adenylyltransferase
MAKGDDTWRSLVHPEVARVIDRIGGVERVRKLAKLENII